MAEEKAILGGDALSEEDWASAFSALDEARTVPRIPQQIAPQTSAAPAPIAAPPAPSGPAAETATKPKPPAAPAPMNKALPLKPTLMSTGVIAKPAPSPGGATTATLPKPAGIAAVPKPLVSASKPLPTHGASVASGVSAPNAVVPPPPPKPVVPAPPRTQGIAPKPTVQLPVPAAARPAAAEGLERKTLPFPPEAPSAAPPPPAPPKVPVKTAAAANTALERTIGGGEPSPAAEPAPLSPGRTETREAERGPVSPARVEPRDLGAKQALVSPDWTSGRGAFGGEGAPGGSPRAEAPADPRALLEERENDDRGVEETLCIFSSGEQLFGLDTAVVSEVLTLESMIDVPLAPASVVGLFNLRGTPVALIDLASMLGLQQGTKNEGPSRSPTVMVLRAGGLVVGVQVSRVAMVLPRKRGVFFPSMDADEASGLRGFLELPGPERATVALLDTEAVLARIESIRRT